MADHSFSLSFNSMMMQANYVAHRLNTHQNLADLASCFSGTAETSVVIEDNSRAIHPAGWPHI